MKTLRALALSLVVCSGALAQNAGLMPVPRAQFFDANGYPLAGGLIYTCVAGSSCPGTPQATYTDSSATVQNANPVVLDAGGFASIWIGQSAYKIVVETAAGVMVSTTDNVQNNGLASTSQLSASLLSSSGATLVKYQAAGSSTSRTVAARLGDVVSVKDFGAAGDGVTDDSTAIQNAINYELGRTNSNGTVGGAVYFPTAQYRINKTLTITKGASGGLTLYGDGPHASQITTPTTGFTGSAALSINSNGGALVVRDLAISAAVGGTPSIDGIYTTGNGQFFERLWLSGFVSGAGFHAFTATSITLSNIISETNQFGFELDTTYSMSLANLQTYHNTAGGFDLVGQVPTSMLGGSGGIVPANEISNCDLLEDTTNGGGNAAIYNSANTPLVLSNVSIASTNTGRPATGIYLDSGTDRVDLSNVHISHAMNYGVYAVAGWISFTGGVVDKLGSYSSITVPPGGYSTTTQSAAIYAGASVSSLTVTGATIRNVAGFGIISDAAFTNLTGNLINGFGLGNSSGGQQNATTGLTALALAPAQTYAQYSVLGNQIASSASGLTGVSYNPTATLASGAFVARNNVLAFSGTAFSTNQTATQLAAQNIDIQGTSNFPGPIQGTTLAATASSNAPFTLTGAGVAFAALGTPSVQNAVTWCTNCTSGSSGSVSTGTVSGSTVSGQTATTTVNACAPGGGGAWAFWNGSSWKCPF